jgi:DNA-binding response OmpR family regulator
MPRILVVDDEQHVRAMIAIVLRVRQFEVVAAANAAAGLKAFEQSSLDAAIIDIFLCDTDGFDLIAAMRERAPDLPIVAVSGITTLQVASPLADLSTILCLQKPFRPAGLMGNRMRAKPCLTKSAEADQFPRAKRL